VLNIQIFELPSATKLGAKSFKNLRVISPSHWQHFLSNSKGNVIIYKCSVILSAQNEEKCSLSKCGMKGGSIKIFWDEGLMNWWIKPLNA